VKWKLWEGIHGNKKKKKKKKKNRRSRRRRRRRKRKKKRKNEEEFCFCKEMSAFHSESSSQKVESLCKTRLHGESGGER
jgi:hypothetical protein